MVKKINSIKGEIDHFPKYQIYLNVNHLEIGTYTLKITHKNKVIKTATFKKWDYEIEESQLSKQIFRHE